MCSFMTKSKQKKKKTNKSQNLFYYFISLGDILESRKEELNVYNENNLKKN